MSTTEALIDHVEAFDTPPGNPEKKQHHGVRCVVVTPEDVAVDEPAEFVAIPLFDGELGVLPGRSPMIGRLGYGELRLRTGSSTRSFFIDGGFAQVRDDVVTILTSRAIPADRVDPVAAQAELETAKSRRATTDLELLEKSRAEGRARAMLHVSKQASAR